MSYKMLGKEQCSLKSKKKEETEQQGEIIESS